MEGILHNWGLEMKSSAHQKCTIKAKCKQCLALITNVKWRNACHYTNDFSIHGKDGKSENYCCM